MSTIHKFKVKGLRGEEIDFSAFAGKKIMIVNVASECGFTKQYSQLQELYKTFPDKIVVIGFPCNDFGGQEPGDEVAIQNFCSVNFGVTFPLTEKISILGDNPHPIYKWLTTKSENGVADSEVAWNFQKYLLDENGQFVKMLPSDEEFLNENFLYWVLSDEGIDRNFFLGIWKNVDSPDDFLLFDRTKNNFNTTKGFFSPLELEESENSNSGKEHYGGKFTITESKILLEYKIHNSGKSYLKGEIIALDKGLIEMPFGKYSKLTEEEANELLPNQKK